MVRRGAKDRHSVCIGLSTSPLKSGPEQMLVKCSCRVSVRPLSTRRCSEVLACKACELLFAAWFEIGLGLCICLSPFCLTLFCAFGCICVWCYLWCQVWLGPSFTSKGNTSYLDANIFLLPLRPFSLWFARQSVVVCLHDRDMCLLSSMRCRFH